MNISNNFRELIVKEIQYVVEKMKKSNSAEEIIYFFSAIYAIIQRVINFECDANLIYIFIVLKGTYDGFAGGFHTIQRGKDSMVFIEEMHLQKLTSITEELGKKLMLNEDIDGILRKFAILSYSITGNGHYLQEKGALKIEDL